MMDTQEVHWEYYPKVAAFPAARSFVERLVLKDKSPKTVDAYARAIEDLLKYFSTTEPTRVLEANEGMLDAYIASLRQRTPKKRGRGGSVTDATKIIPITGRKLSRNTIALHVVACRLFYDFLIRRQWRLDVVNPIERGHDGRGGQRPVRGPVGPDRRTIWIPLKKEWEAFVHYLLEMESPRNQAMILLAYTGALRREELLSLRITDIDWALECVTIRAETTKGGRTRVIPITTAVLHLVRSYIDGDRRSLLAAYNGDEEGLLFLSESTRNPAQPLRVGAFNDIMERLRRQVQLPALTPHTLRHLRCTVLRRAKVREMDIADIAGHKRLETTRGYTRLTATELRERIEPKVNPFDAHIRKLVEHTLSQKNTHD